MQVVRDLVAIADSFGLESEVLAASIRHPRDVTEAALAGARLTRLEMPAEQPMGRALRGPPAIRRRKARGTHP